MSQVKVVELNVERGKQPQLPPIVHTIRQQSKKQLNELLQTLFNNTDDALFELADRSQSDQHQEMYFDSMRLIRLHRKTLASTFMRDFHDSFAKVFGARVAAVETDTTEEPGADDYTLVDQDQLEMSVAVSGIVSKVTSQHSLAVMQLTKRFDFLAKTESISERTNPLGPHALSTLFADAMGTLELSIKIRIILMKLFERFVMERLGPLYDAVNRSLINADVLPDMKQSSTAPARTSSDTSPDPMSVAQPAAPAAPGQATGGFGFNTVQTLMAGARASGDGGTGPLTAAAPGNPAGSGPDIGTTVLPPMASHELLAALSGLQSDTQADEIDIERVPQVGDLRSMVLAYAGSEQKSLGQADDDTVNFVGMLFDYILNDRNLAIPMKALIGRLQIPIVKLAILDKTFFEKSAHPARALLNELSSAGIGWSGARELKRDALYNKIESVIIRVLNEFNENPDIFAELLKDLRAFVSNDSRRSVLVEQRVKESEAGKAKTHGAKLQVQNLVNQKASGLRLPSEAGRFISEIWSRVLTLRMVKYGEASPAWTGGVATLDNLLWTLQPLSELEDVAHRDQCSAELLQDIQDGMAELGCTPEEAEDFKEWLAGHLRDLSENDRAYLEDDERPELGVSSEFIEEIVLAPALPEIDESAIDPACAAQLKLVTEGTWVEIKRDDDKLLRCKLATITQPGYNYIFVNRRGMKVMEQDRGQLASLITEDRLKLIDESQVFDRALQSVIGSLRQMQRDRVK